MTNTNLPKASTIAIIENDRPSSSAFTYLDKILFKTNARILMNASNVRAKYIIGMVVASVCLINKEGTSIGLERKK